MIPGSGVGVEVSNRSPGLRFEIPTLIPATRDLGIMYTAGSHKLDRNVTNPRVSVEDYLNNIEKITAVWPDVPVLYFVFPNLNSEISGHDQVLIDKGGIHFTKMFGEDEFFQNDRIHINKRGNQHLAAVLVPYIGELLSKSEHVK